MTVLVETTRNHPTKKLNHIGGWNLYLLIHHANMPTTKVELPQEIMQ
jgi:hypothetical protein